MAIGFAADHVNGRSVFEVKRFPQFTVGVDLSRKLALRINHEGQIHLMIDGKLLRELAQVGGKDFGLVLKDVVAEVQPSCRERLSK